MSVIGDILNANSTGEISATVKNAGKKANLKLNEEVSKASSQKNTKIFLAIVATLMIGAITYMAWLGGNYLFSYAGFIAIFFGILDVTLIMLLTTNALKGRWRYFALAFEIASLFYLGYAMGGYFGGGNLKNATEGRMTAMYQVSEEYRSNAESVADLMQRSINNAKNVRGVEEKRDGKGVVFEKADFISGMKPATVQSLKMGNVPTFKSLIEANKWLDEQRRLIMEAVSDYESSENAMKSQARSTDAGLQQAIKMQGLSQQQVSNLQVLSSSMKEIAEYPKVTSVIPENKLGPKDLKADGFQSYIGYLIDIIIVFLIVMIALQRNPEGKLNEIKEEEVRSIMQSILEEQNINYDPDMVKNIPIRKQIDALKIAMSNEHLTDYIRKNASFDEYLLFAKEYPVIARNLGSTTWSFAEIKKQLEADSNFINIAQDALKISPADWKTINAIKLDVNRVIQMKDETRKAFLQLLSILRAKTKFRDAELGEFISQFIYQEEMSSEFLKTLEICISKLDGNKIRILNSSFVNSASPEVASYLCIVAEQDKQFERIVNGWNENIDRDLSKILSNGVMQEAGSDRFFKIVINFGGIDGIKKAVKGYNDKQSEANSTTIGDKSVTLKPDFVAIKDAATKEDDEAFMKAIEDAFQLQTVKI